MIFFFFFFKPETGRRSEGGKKSFKSKNEDNLKMSETKFESKREIKHKKIFFFPVNLFYFLADWYSFWSFVSKKIAFFTSVRFLCVSSSNSNFATLTWTSASSKIDAK